MNYQLKNKIMFKIKTLKLKPEDHIGKRFKECRKWFGLTQRDIISGNNHSVITKFETTQGDVGLLHLAQYLKSINIKQIAVTLNDYGVNLETSTKDYGRDLEKLRLDKKLNSNSFKPFIFATSIRRLEQKTTEDVQMKVLYKYTKALGIKTLIINII
jgi:hypothetical protein